MEEGKKNRTELQRSDINIQNKKKKEMVCDIQSRRWLSVIRSEGRLLMLEDELDRIEGKGAIGVSDNDALGELESDLSREYLEVGVTK